VKSVIRRALPDDCQALRALVRAAKGYWHYSSDYMQVWDYDQCITPEFIVHYMVRCAVDGSEIIGFYAYSTEGEIRELKHLWVAPEHIGTGVGRRLLLDAIEKLRSAGVSKVQIVADPNSEGFYRRMGARRLPETRPGPLEQQFPVLVLDVDTVD
jgi:N-acetylglutamate synthase-like GNAT family acetyltransferase